MARNARDTRTIERDQKMDKVLLLNASYTPLRVLPYKRAVALVLQDKADVVEERSEVIRSSSLEMNLPSVIRLRYYVNVPYNARVALNRRAVIARDGGVCAYNCGRRATTIDHVVPRSRGGKHEWTNVVACCGPCNHKKADKLLSEIGWELHTTPRVPDSSIWIAAGVQGREEWEAYV